MPNTRTLIRVPAGARAPEVASFFAQLDTLSASMWKALADLKPAEIEWQPKRGMNTIGMLLAHSAMTETFWLALATGGRTMQEGVDEMTGLWDVPWDFDGMPAKPDARHPKTLRGWSIAKYRAFYDKARKDAKRRAARLRPVDLGNEISLVREDGSLRIVNPRWVFYHVLEHQAGHYGQMLLLRHQYRDRKKK